MNDGGAEIQSRKLLVVVGAGVLLRVIWALFVPVIPVSDAFAYDTFARTLLEHGVFGWTQSEPFAFWPPGTTFLHVAVYWLFGTNHAAIVALNIALSAGIIYSAGRVAARFLGERVGFVTALVLAVWPTLVMYPTILASELPYVFATTLALDVWTAPRGTLITRGVLAGALLGFASLTRPHALLLLPLYVVAVVFHRGLNRATVVRQAALGALAAVTMAAVIAPWTWRNYELLGHLVVVSSNAGVTLWMGNSPEATGGFVDPPDEIERLPEYERAAALRERAREYIIADPVGFVVRALHKVVLLFRTESVGVDWNAGGIASAFGDSSVGILRRGAQLGWAVVFLAAVGGFLVLMRRGLLLALVSPFVLTAGLHTAIHAVTVASDRYHLAFFASIATLSAVGIVAMLDARRRWRERVTAG